MATTHLTDPKQSALIPWESGQMQRAWSLLGHMLGIGGTALPAELVTRCGVLELSPELVNYLSSVPGSPLKLWEDRRVSLALDSFNAYAGYDGELTVDVGSILSHLGSRRIERMVGGLSWTFDCEFQSRKRKGSNPLALKVMTYKRRARPTSCTDNEIDRKALDACVFNTPKSYSQISLIANNHFNIGDSRSSFKGELKRLEEREVSQPKANDNGSGKIRKVSSDKMKITNKKKLRSVSEPQKLSMPSRKRLRRNADKKDILSAKIHDNVKESEQAGGRIDQTKRTSLSETCSGNKLPNFESFTVEMEEGSGGYGTVYKARRTKDDEIFAIKCPHPSANRQYVYNELSMLQRFGGKNFIIRLEDSFKHGNSCCFVLEHIVHDQPEVLKREINVSQLRWYAYCMFEALASLHKQGVVHRDIKPGNFLFSREVNIGYLIDFNLAMDLHQKNKPSYTPKTDSDAKAVHALLPGATNPPAKSRKFINTKNKDTGLKTIERESVADSKILKSAASQTKASAPLCKDKQISHQSHVALDGSGVTSTKDLTSSRTQLDRMRQPMPFKGRKEILKLAHEALRYPSHEAVRLPTSKNKRIPAPPEKIDRKLFCYSPMPLHSSGVAVAGSGLLSHKGDEKIKKEGPCAGTKGFRAPEVLFKSVHQGPKVDVWSAGVTLLYLIMGKTPFYGDPNENIKNIAKLRGGEDLWEVAKLHNQESAFPVELFDVKFLPSMKLREWCQQHSKRPSFIKEAPNVLFDFVDKCLTVNPRLRISAEEALQHEFLTPCHNLLREQRLLSSPIIQHMPADLLT